MKHNKNYTIITRILLGASALAVSLARQKLMKPGIDQCFLCNGESV